VRHFLNEIKARHILPLVAAMLVLSACDVTDDSIPNAVVAEQVGTAPIITDTVCDSTTLPVFCLSVGDSTGAGTQEIYSGDDVFGGPSGFIQSITAMRHTGTDLTGINLLLPNSQMSLYFTSADMALGTYALDGSTVSALYVESNLPNISYSCSINPECFDYSSITITNFDAPGGYITGTYDLVLCDSVGANGCKNVAGSFNAPRHEDDGEVTLPITPPVTSPVTGVTCDSLDTAVFCLSVDNAPMTTYSSDFATLVMAAGVTLTTSDSIVVQLYTPDIQLALYLGKPVTASAVPYQLDGTNMNTWALYTLVNSTDPALSVLHQNWYLNFYDDQSTVTISRAGTAINEFMTGTFNVNVCRDPFVSLCTNSSTGLVNISGQFNTPLVN